MPFPVTFPNKYIAIDTETTGLRPWDGFDARVFCMAGVWPDRSVIYHRQDYDKLDISAPEWRQFRAVWEDPDVDLVFTNAKFDWRMVERTFGWTARGRVWDTSIFCHLLDGRDAAGGLSLDAQARKYVPQEAQKVVKEIEDWLVASSLGNLIKGKKYGHLFKDMPPELIRKRCVGDATLTLAVFQRLYTTVATYFPFLLELEHKLLPVVKRMEDRGVLIDRQETAAQMIKLQKVVDDVTDTCEGVVGDAFNLNSPNDQRRILEQCGLYEKIGEFTKPARNRKSSKPFIPKRKLSAEQLFLLHHPVAAMMLVGKQAGKMISPFLTNILEFADAHDVLHAGFNQVGTTSGRFSSSEPNLQNVPTEGDKKGNLTEDEAQELEYLTGYRLGVHIKRCFLVRPGFAHIHGDKKQAEMVALAHYTADPILLDIFAQGISIHDGMCRALFPEEREITKGLKQRSKQVTFGYMYGMMPPTLSKRLRSSVSEATSMQRRLGKTFVGLPAWNKDLERQLMDRGYVETIHGRRHYLHRNEGYMAVNRMCQGTVGDEIKACMVALDEYFGSEWNHECQILLNIHDDIASEVPLEIVPEVTPRIYDIMQQVSRPYILPMPSSLDITYTRWSDLKELDKPWDPSTYPQYQPTAMEEGMAAHDHK